MLTYVIIINIINNVLFVKSIQKIVSKHVKKIYELLKDNCPIIESKTKLVLLGLSN